VKFEATDLNKIRKMYFVGIGGIGMSALARYFNSKGVAIYGYDKTRTSFTDTLVAEGMKIHFEANVELVKSEIGSSLSETLVVYTPAVPASHAEFKYFSENNFSMIKRAQLLGLLTKNNFTIAVAGTHGKTTTSSLVAHILMETGQNTSAFLGGIAKNFHSNLVLPKNNSEEQFMVVEADEYDRSFLNLYPDAAIVTSIDPDHLDIYGDKEKMTASYMQFIAQIKDNGVLISRKNLAVKTDKKHIEYSVTGKADYHAENIRVVNHENVFDIQWQRGVVKDVSSRMAGKHNVENTIAAFACAHYLGIQPEAIRDAIKKFTGVERRFDLRFNSNKVVYIDDYAHHPEELRACIQSVKELYAGKKITGIFQPHLFSRTRDFVDAFAEVLSMLDTLILLDIYPAREEPIPGITSEIILKRVKTSNKVMLKKEEVIPFLEKNQPELILTLGAGDIDRLVEPITKFLEKKYGN
jgi:UDP-N-acetylmuramate--alanine ligase